MISKVLPIIVGRMALRGFMALSGLFVVGALYYSTVELTWLRIGLTVLAALLLAGIVITRPLRIGLICWCTAMTTFMVWYRSDDPMNERDWAPEYAVHTSWSQTGQVICIDNVRNFTYRSESDFTPAYYDASYSLNKLKAAELVVSYWAGDAIAHVFVTFGFSDGKHLAISIETRRQKRFNYSAIAGLFHHYELFYVVADEKDLIGVRTDIRHERVFLYELNMPHAAEERLFVSYLSQVQRLSKKPEWYNTVTDNCTTGILDRADAKSRTRYDWRIIFSGYAAEVAYEQGLLDNRLPFQAVKAESLIRRPTGATIDSDYSKQIRIGHPQ